MCFRRGKKKRSPFHNADITDKNKLLLTNYYNIISYKPIDVTFLGAKVQSFYILIFLICTNYIILCFNVQILTIFFTKSPFYRNKKLFISFSKNNISNSGD